MRIQFIASVLLIIFSHLSNATSGTLGNCVDYDFSKFLDSAGAINTNRSLRIVRQNAIAFADMQGDTEKTRFNFGDYVVPMRLSEPRQRIQVRDYGGNTLGWIPEEDLLCSFTPLQSEKGLDRKAFIKTPDAREPALTSVPAYPSPSGTECYDRCKRLSRFRLYFIFADDSANQRYLLTDHYNLAVDPPPPLVGWVDYANIIPWDTTVGMRPKEEVKNISAYRQPGDTSEGAKREGIELSGGKIWYTFPVHIPLLNIVDDYYHVAAPSIGMQGFKPMDTEEVFGSLKQVDIFFLLDGTASMQPFIKAAQKAAQNIAEKLRNTPRFMETSFRFGFRIYRDVYADTLTRDDKKLCQGGVCEGMPLSAETCQFDSEATEANWQAFKQQINKVTETKDDKDDYPEKLFDGLRQAVQNDMASCEQRTKMLFVIGDHGDKEATIPEDIINSLTKDFSKPVVVFFIQTPNEARADAATTYQEAYNSFKNQGQQLLDHVLTAEFKGEKIDAASYFLSLGEEQLPEKIASLVKGYSSSEVVNEIEQAVAGGDSLENILKQKMKQGDMPVLYWKVVDETVCRALGTQCEVPIDHKVIDFYIPIDKEKIQEEVWMTAKNLDNWLELLKPFETVIGDYSIPEQRQKFTDLLQQQVLNILGGYPKENLALGEQLLMNRKNAIPVREQGPLLQYSIKEIREEVPGCELTRLAGWVESVRQVLQKVYANPTVKVSFTLQQPFTPCPLTEKGKRVPKMVFEQAQKLGPDDTYRYDHELYGQSVYWLPMEFLP